MKKNQKDDDKEEISKSVRGVKVYHSCFVKTYDYIIGIDHYCYRLFSNINCISDATYYAIEALANGYQIPESRLECIKIGMINQLKDIQVNYLEKLNKNEDLNMIECSKILDTLCNMLRGFSDITFGSNNEILIDVINTTRHKLSFFDFSDIC